jgi:hypothetical protein
LLAGGCVTVTVLVLVLTDGLDDVVSVLVSVDGAVVSVTVDGGTVVSVTVAGGATSDADVAGAEVEVVVVDVVLVLSDVSSESRLTDNQMISATNSAMRAPNATSAAGFRYQGTGGSGG